MHIFAEIAWFSACDSDFLNFGGILRFHVEANNLLLEVLHDNYGFLQKAAL